MFGRADKCIDFLAKFIELSKSGEKINLSEYRGCKYLKDLLNGLIRNLKMTVHLDDISIDLNNENLIKDVLENDMNIEITICRMTEKDKSNSYAKFVYYPVIKLGEKIHILRSIKIEKTNLKYLNYDLSLSCYEIDKQNLTNKFRIAKLYVAYTKR